MMRTLSFLFVFFAIILFSGCGKPEKLPVLPTKLSSEIVSESFQVKYLFSEQARLKAKLETGRVQEKKEGQKETSTGVHYFDRGVKLTFFDETGQQETVLTSQTGKMNKEEGLADLQGKVVAQSKDGSKLETEQLFWDEKKDKIYTAGYVHIQTATRILEGDGFESNTAMTRYRILKARGQLQVENIE